MKTPPCTRVGTARRTTAHVAFAFLVATTTALPANAQRAGAKPPAAEKGPPADVETAEHLYAKLDYDQANVVAERVVKRSSLTHDQLVRAYRVLAVTYAILDKDEQARDAFFQLLILEPDYQADPNLGPKVNTPFIEARGSFRSLPTRPGVDVTASLSMGGGTLRVATRDPTRIVKKVNVGYRWTSSGAYAVTHMNANESTGVEVPAPPVGRTRLDYWAQALDERDNAVFEAGNAAVPKSAFVEGGTNAGAGAGAAGAGAKKSDGSIFSSPIFWVVAGAAVVGGGTALFFALRPEDPPTRAALTPVILCGTDRCN